MSKTRYRHLCFECFERPGLFASLHYAHDKVHVWSRNAGGDVPQPIAVYIGWCHTYGWR